MSSRPKPTQSRGRIASRDSNASPTNEQKRSKKSSSERSNNVSMEAREEIPTVDYRSEELQEELDDNDVEDHFDHLAEMSSESDDDGSVPGTSDSAFGSNDRSQISESEPDKFKSPSADNERSARLLLNLSDYSKFRQFGKHVFRSKK